MDGNGVVPLPRILDGVLEDARCRGDNGDNDVPSRVSGGGAKRRNGMAVQNNAERG